MGMVATARSLGWRMYQDYVMPSRLPDYRALLAAAARHGYRVVGVDDWATLLRDGNAATAGRLLVMRHDIDTDAPFSLDWARAEHEVGARASYFFRLSTMQPDVIEAVARLGHHVSYHFEELADVAKARRLRTPEQVKQYMPEIRERFADNLARLRRQFGWDGHVVCSHGDWMNRRLGLRNLELLADPAVRAQLDVRHETYDAELMQPLQGYYTDAQPPAWWRKTGSPLPAIEAGLAPIGILTHPRQWRPNLVTNTRETIRRVSEGLAYARS